MFNEHDSLTFWHEIILEKLSIRNQCNFYTRSSLKEENAVFNFYYYYYFLVVLKKFEKQHIELGDRYME